MRICMLTSAVFPPREGMGFYIWNLSSQLVQLGHSVQIITRGSMRSRYRGVLEGVPVWKLPFLSVYPMHVHFHSLFVDRLLRDLEKDLDLIHLHTPLVRYPRSNLPSLVTVHTPMKVDSQQFAVDSPYSALVKIQVPISVRLENEIFSKTEEIAAVSNSVAKELTAYGINGSSVAVLGNGVDPKIFSPRYTQQEEHQMVILTVCRIGPRKGLEDLITCARLVATLYPKVRFCIAGDGPHENKIKRLVRSNNLQDNVILLGHITDREKLVERYQSATIFVHPAHYEGLPTVLLEAMSCGRPVVVTAVSGALDVVENDKNGLLVPAHNPQQMAEAIFRILDNPDLADRLGRAARNTIEQRYSWQQISLNYLSIYERLLY